VPPLEVDPEALSGAGAAVVAVGEGLGAVISTLTTALSGTAGMAGDDPAGGAFGRSYNSSASRLVEAMTTTRNGLCRLGDGVRMSAYNYSVAEALSNVAGDGDPLAVPASTGFVSAGAAPSAVGASVNAPAGWGWVAKYIGMIWPTGDSARLRAAAAAWSAAGTEFLANEKFGVAGSLGIVRAQQIPEGEAIVAALTDADHGCTTISHQCATIATQLGDYAAKIDKTHAAILDLLARICDPLTGIKEVWDILTDKDEDEIKKIANDIRTVVNDFTAEVDALRHQITALLSDATTVAATMGGYAAKEWDQFLHGTEVGRVLNQVGQFGKGLGEEAGGLAKDVWTYSTVRAAIDPDGWHQSWKQMIDGMTPLVGLGGEHAPGVGEAWKDLGKEVTHWDEWKTNPAEAAGKSAFDVATLFAPGGAAAAAGKGGRAAADAAEAAAKAGREQAAASRALGDAAKSTGEAGAPARAPHAPRIEPPSAERSPLPPDKPAAPAPPKPASAPTDGQLPHSPTESKSLVAAKSETGDAPTVPPGSSPRAPEPPISPREPIPVREHPGPATLAGANEPQFALMSPSHGHNPDSYPGGIHPPEPPPPPGVLGGSGKGYSGGMGDGGHRAGGGGGDPALADGSGHDLHQSGDSSPTGRDNALSTGLTDEKRDEILAMEKGIRPDPSEYLSQEYIQHHLEQFSQGGTRFMMKDTFEDFGIGQIDGTTFVFPSSEIDTLMEKTKGDPAALEKALGLPDGYFKDNVIRVDIRDLEHYDLRIPSGNEAGANVKWLPGGLLPQGMPEAVIDGSKVPFEDLTVDDLPSARKE
jgi:hypothetical protein